MAHSPNKRMDNPIRFYITVTRRGGEIGRHAGLRSLCGQPRVGSSPSLGMVVAGNVKRFVVSRFALKALNRAGFGNPRGFLGCVIIPRGKEPDVVKSD